jgi:[protein-PII] uridylyltransferase
VQDHAGQPLGEANPKHLRRLVEALERAACGEVPPAEPRRPGDQGRASAFAIASSATVDNEASQHATVVETSGRDRLGLVEALARAMSDSGLSIQSAHVHSHGERAVDAFYVVTEAGGKLMDPQRTSAVRARLIEVLEDADGGGSQTGRLPRARASSAR